MSALTSARQRRFGTLREGLFGTFFNSLVTLAVLAALAWIVPSLVRWAIIDATWTGTAEHCHAGNGACWAFVSAKLRFILFAFYPPELQWRPALAIGLLVMLFAGSALPRFWGSWLIVAWPATLAAAWTLLAGFGILPTVSANQFGGLPVTLLVWATCFSTALPLAILLALARRSQMGGVRTLATAFIEVLRAIPMVAILYIAMLILPMALPGGDRLDKISRAMLMIMPFWAAYLAEVVRGGLQAIPRGQFEAASSLGLDYWQSLRHVVLPQALTIVIPGLTNLAIGFFLATSLLTVIGTFDLLNAARAAAADTAWLGFYDEAYFVAAAIYFSICFCASRYSPWLERELRAGRA